MGGLICSHKLKNHNSSVLSSSQLVPIVSHHSHPLIRDRSNGVDGRGNTEDINWICFHLLLRVIKLSLSFAGSFELTSSSMCCFVITAARFLAARANLLGLYRKPRRANLRFAVGSSLDNTLHRCIVRAYGDSSRRRNVLRARAGGAQSYGGWLKNRPSDSLRSHRQRKRPQWTVVRRE